MDKNKINESESQKEDDKSEKKRLISFTKINKYFIFPFLSPIVLYIRDHLLNIAQYKNEGVHLSFQYEFMDGLMHSGCIILYLISCLKSMPNKKETNIVRKKTAKTNCEKDEINNNNNKGKIFFIILIIASFLYCRNCKW